MVVLEPPVKPSILDEASSILDELLIEECEWNDAGFMPEDGVGLTPEDLAEWVPPGFPPELECETFSVLDYEPVTR